MKIKNEFDKNEVSKVSLILIIWKEELIFRIRIHIKKTSLAASLFYHDIDFVAIVHLKCLRRVVVLNSFAIEDKATLVIGETLSLAVGLH